jgi:RIO kinase 1
VDASANNQAKWMLERVVNNISPYSAQYAPELLNIQYSREIWALYEAGELHPEAELTGYFKESTRTADVDTVLEEIKAAFAEEEERQLRMQVPVNTEPGY